MRPEGIPDPRSEDTPIRMDDERMDRARGRKTIQELLEQSGNMKYARLPVETEPLEFYEIAPERLAALRARRDAIIAELQERLES